MAIGKELLKHSVAAGIERNKPVKKNKFFGKYYKFVSKSGFSFAIISASFHRFDLFCLL